MSEEDKQTEQKQTQEVEKKPSEDDALNAKLNKVVTSHMKRFEKSLDEKLAKLLAKPQQQEAESEDDEENVAKPTTASQTQAQVVESATAAQLKKLQKQLAAAEKERAEERRAREEQSAKIARDEERSKAGEVLSGLGMQAAQQKAVLALFSSEGRVKRSAENKIVFLDAEGDEQDLVAGIKAWAATDEGKSFLPARGVAGSGEKPQRPGGGQKLPSIPKDRKTLLAESLLKATGLVPRS